MRALAPAVDLHDRCERLTPALGADPSPATEAPGTMAAPASAVSRLRLLAMGLAPAVGAASTVLVLSHPAELPTVGLVLLVLLVPVGVFQPVPKLALTIGAAAMAFQIGLVVLGLGSGGWWAALAAPGFLLVAAVAEGFGRECAVVDGQRARVARLVEDLTPTDSVAGVTKWSHAQPTFARELARSHRYKQPLTLLMVTADQWERVSRRLGHEAAKAAVAEIGGHLVAACRNVDVVTYRDGATFGLLLPDTPLVGAEVVARRIAALACAGDAVRLRVGLATATAEIETVEQFVQDAEMACSIAERLGRGWLACGSDDYEHAAPNQPTSLVVPRSGADQPVSTSAVA